MFIHSSIQKYFSNDDPVPRTMFGFGNTKTDDAPRFLNSPKAFSCHRLLQTSCISPSPPIPQRPHQLRRVYVCSLCLTQQLEKHFSDYSLSSWVTETPLSSSKLFDPRWLTFPFAFHLVLQPREQSRIGRPSSGFEFGLCPRRALSPGQVTENRRLHSTFPCSSVSSPIKQR